MRQLIHLGTLLVLGLCGTAALGQTTIEEIRRATENAESVGLAADSEVPGAPTGAEESVELDDPAPSSSFLAFEGEVPKGAWVEVMPLAPTGRPWLWRHTVDEAGEDQQARGDGETGVQVLPESLPAGPAMVCAGVSRPPGVTFRRSTLEDSGPKIGVHCSRVYLLRQAARPVAAEVASQLLAAEAPAPEIVPAPDPEDLSIAIDFAPGLAIAGRYLMDGLPVEGARVSLVPDRLEASRAFTLPLAVEADVVRREAVTDADGHFRLPPVRAGRYRLETALPTGRVHRPPAFELPLFADVAVETGPLADNQGILWDLGELEVQDWLAVETSVIDELGEPIFGAEVSARQGQSARDLVAFRGLTDERGWVRLSGFDPELPIRLDCRAPGHGAWGADFELLPVEVVCRLERLARIEGELLTPDSEPAVGGLVSADLEIDPLAEPEPFAGQPPGGAESVPARALSVPGEGGVFSLELAPGRHVLTAAAPGFIAERRTVDVAAGEVLELGTITLLPGRPLEGRVLEAAAPAQGPPPLIPEDAAPEPVPFAEIHAVEPPGAAAATADVDGFFELTSIGDEPLLLEVSAEGFAAERIELTPDEQRRGESLEIELHRGGWIRALVFEAGEPCGGCRLRLLPGDLELTTDVSGQAVTRALKPGLYRVEKPRVLHLGSQWVEVESAVIRRTRVVADEISTVRFELEPERWAVRFEPSLESPSRDGHDWRLIARNSFGEERIERDEDGLFHVPRPHGEPQQIFLSRFDAHTGHEMEVRVAMLDPSVVAGSEPLGSAQLSSPLLDPSEIGAQTAGAAISNPAREATVLPLPSGSIEGRVRGYAPEQGTLQPLAGVRVRLQTVAGGAHIAELRTDAEGHFELHHVPPGVFSLLFGERAFQFISITRGTSLDLGEFQLVEGGY